MTLLEATLFLLSKEVPPPLYAVGKLGPGDNVGIMRDGQVWQVFFNERGYADSIETFESEEDAVARFLQRLDRHSRGYGNPSFLSEA